MFSALLNFFKQRRLRRQRNREVDRQIRDLLFLGQKVYDALIDAELKIGSKALGITSADVSELKDNGTEYTITYRNDDRLTVLVRNFCDWDGKYGKAYRRLHSIAFILDGSRVTDYKYYVSLTEIVLENIEKKVCNVQDKNLESLNDYLQQNRLRFDELFRQLGYA